MWFTVTLPHEFTSNKACVVYSVDLSFTDDSTMLEFKVYVENLTLPGDYKNLHSNTYNMFLGVVTKAFADLKGSLRSLELEQK